MDLMRTFGLGNENEAIMGCDVDLMRTFGLGNENEAIYGV
jgi:hypothetical protein